MRTAFLTLVAVVFVALATPGRVSAEADASKLVSEYITPTMPQTRREQIVKELATIIPSTIAGQLKKALPDDSLRPHALALAIKFQVPGLFATAKKYYDTDDRALVIEYGLLTLEKGADKFLQDRWAAAEGDEFKTLHDAFQQYGVTPETVAGFLAVIEDDKATDVLRAAALEVVCYQTGSSASDIAEMQKLWPDLYKELRKTGNQLSCSGVDMLRRRPWTRSGCTQWGCGVRVSGGQTVCETAIPPGFDKGKYTLTASIWLEGDDAKGRFLLQAPAPNGALYTYPIHYDDKKWWIETASLKYGNGDTTTGRWLKVRWQVVMPHPKPELGEYLLTIDVDGKKAVTLDGSGKPNRLTLECEAGAIIIGAVDYVRN